MGRRNNSTVANAVMRKSNTAKGKSYALAYGMIRAAMEKDCPLQAIAIEESIITDRLSSTLNVGKDKAEPCSSLGQVLRERNGNPLKGVAPNANAALFDKEMVKLLPRLEAWWRNRNAMLHGIAKSACGEGPEIESEAFMETARQVAVEGKDLADIIKKWTAKQVGIARGKKTNQCETGAER